MCECEKCRPKKKEKRKLDFSKIILVVMMITFAYIIIFSSVLMWVIKDTSALPALIGSALAEVGVATGFYFNKAKAENKIKLMKIYDVEPRNEDFNT